MKGMRRMQTTSRGYAKLPRVQTQRGELVGGEWNPQLFRHLHPPGTRLYIPTLTGWYKEPLCTCAKMDARKRDGALFCFFCGCMVDVTRLDSFFTLDSVDEGEA